MALTAVYPGSFDPPTRGHLDVIERALRLVDRLVVAVVANPGKSPLFTLEERLDLVREAMGELDGAERVEVVSFEGLTVDLAHRLGARWLVRGIRSAADAAAELPMALSNRRCGAVEIDTLFLPASAEVAFVASRLVREIAREGGRLDAFVTPVVERALREKLGQGGVQA